MIWKRNQIPPTGLDDLKSQLQSMIGAAQELGDTDTISENMVNLVTNSYIIPEKKKSAQYGYDVAAKQFKRLVIYRNLAIALSIPMTIIIISYIGWSHQPKVLHDLRPEPPVAVNVLVPSGPLSVVSYIVQQSVDAEQNTGPNNGANIDSAYQLSQQAVNMTKGMNLSNKELAYSNTLFTYNNATHDTACSSNYNATPNCDPKFDPSVDNGLPSTNEYRQTARSISKSLGLIALAR